MMRDMSKKSAGREGEEIACRFLERKGYRVLKRNYRHKTGEIDIVAEKDGFVHFVEVKAVSRENSPDGSREMDYRPEELVHESKLRKVVNTATLYMDEHEDSREFQIDVVGVVMNRSTHTAHCRLFEQVL